MQQQSRSLYMMASQMLIIELRVGIESILYEYIYQEQTPEALAAHFPTLTLEQIYATILYYLHNREKVEAYLLDWLEYGRQAREEQERNPPPVVVRLRAHKNRQPQINAEIS
jgi:uncharacterized protein (DUF433 family)